MMPIVMPATSALKIAGPSPTGQMSRRKGVIPRSAKKPNTTVGIPASTSSAGLSTFRVPGLAYSLR